MSLFMHVKSINVTAGSNFKKNRKMVLLYKNIKNEYQNDDISTIEESLEVPGVSKYTDNIPKRYFDDLDFG